VLENGEVVRLGSNEPRLVDVRIVSATNRDIDAMVADGAFRQDLFFRIKGVTIQIPPLRERREDIPTSATNGVRFQKKNLRHFVRTSLRIHGSAADDQTALVKMMLTLSMTTATSGFLTIPTYQSLHQGRRG
jgi:transcriptional regulator with GAF, ATPase, and Fis domain